MSTDVRTKLQVKHGVEEDEVCQAFENKCGLNLIDDREDHRTDPPTLWFVSETNRQRVLKICFVFKGPEIWIKTAYEPNAEEIRIYEKLGK